MNKQNKTHRYREQTGGCHGEDEGDQKLQISNY